MIENLFISLPSDQCSVPLCVVLLCVLARGERRASERSSGRPSVPTPDIERARRVLATRRVHSIPRVGLTPTQIEALGL